MYNKQVYIGIDTSNYTTSIAVCNENGEIIANIKKLLDVKEGERGLRQSDAVFAHIKNLSLLAPTLAEIMQDLKNIMKPNACMVLSGILDEKKDIVLESIEKHNLKLVEITSQDQWVGIIVQKID